MLQNTYRYLFKACGRVENEEFDFLSRQKVPACIAWSMRDRQLHA